MTTVWMTVTVLKCRRLHCLCMPYILSNVQIYTLLYVEYWLKKTVSKCFNYWEYGRSPNIYLHPSVIVRPWLTTWSTIPLISSVMCLCSWPLLPLPLFCLCTLPPFILTPRLPLSCWPWWFSGCSSIVRMYKLLCCPLSLCYPIEGSWDTPLSSFRELVYNWLIYILFISESQDSLAQFMTNLHKV